jgi:hypothetical protein
MMAGKSERTCDCDRCGAPAAYAITFKGVSGHVHDCEAHTAELRMWADVETIQSLPCPYGHLVCFVGSIPVGPQAFRIVRVEDE